jgi:hypothetical protein
MRRCLVLKGERRGGGEHCCAEMAAQANHSCPEHPDLLVYYSPAFREYGLVNHAGGEVALIDFCPWCGARLPGSLRRRWFQELEARGINPWQAPVPGEFLSSAWWSGGPGTATS